MDTTATAAVFAALSQPTRLEVLRLLAASGPQGLRAGAIADRLGVVASTLSHHLGQLENAGLIRSRRQGRFVLYSTNPEGAQRLLADVTLLCAVRQPDRAAPLQLRAAAVQG